MVVLSDSKIMKNLHRHHVAAGLANLEATREALRLAIICAAIELDIATGLDVKDLGKGLAFSGPTPQLSTEPRPTARESLSGFLNTLPAGAAGH